ncbi:hypothetical protein [Zunongwangia sp. H14]|uniref:hypothetical protein n=1 Tax=Zunongwangia sp. H14 TaxID=3240792 RepID=UPI003564C7DD
MLAYLEEGEIKESLKNLIKNYIKECEESNELSQNFIELVKHNFLAKYVYYNPEKKMVEIGINRSKSRKSYPKIQVYNFPLERAPDWLGEKFKTARGDLEFYASLIKRNNFSASGEVFVM